MAPISILYLEDSTIDFELSLSLLRRAGIEHQAKRVQTEADFTSALQTGCADLILADYALPSFDGMSALQLARKECPETPFIFVSGAIGEELAIDSLHSGATDYVFKHRMERLSPAVSRALMQANDRRARKSAEAELESLLKREQTGRAQAEEQARELMQVNAELEQFAYVASHDLQEPLRMVKLYSQLLARRYTKFLDETGLEFIKIIEDGVDRMHHLIEDLLSYSRISHDEAQSLHPVELNSVVRRTLDGLAPALQEHQATVDVGSLPTILGDGDRMSYVFQNLLTNSLKYRNSHPPHIEIAATKDGSDWVVSVKDNGIGFEQQYAEDVFGLFKRLHGNRYPGTGIGLAIVRRVVEQHGGRIWAQSAPNEGTSFFFTMKSVGVPTPSEH
jgi:signal transduction histidine kinase